MPSPFPGMDPYLEDPGLWSNVHQSLVTYARDQLQRQVGERYFVTIGERVYPDVHVTEQPAQFGALLTSEAADRPTVVLLDEVERREVFLEIQDAGTDQRVVTVVEVLSPSNKAAGRGRERYLRKQEEVLASSAHLVEVDLLRGGQPTVALPEGYVRRSAYRVSVSRADDRRRRELYAFGLRDPLPRVAVPLGQGDPDVVLDLPALLGEAYDRGAYARRLSYAGPPPPPPLSPEDQGWARELLAAPRP
ncbi:MAG: DUF4058 family protein [Planctomycetes bacterium]|nr:DUF4058 family protein [Planctomycetota bacterium]